MTQPARVRLLSTAIALTSGDRNQAYGDPSVNLTCHAELLAVYEKYAKGKHHPSHDAAIIQVLAKLSRIACGSFREDNYIDGAAYFGIAGECELLAINDTWVTVSKAGTIANLLPDDIQ